VGIIMFLLIFFLLMAIIPYQYEKMVMLNRFEKSRMT
jgi:hypothetical protein